MDMGESDEAICLSLSQQQTTWLLQIVFLLTTLFLAHIIVSNQIYSPDSPLLLDARVSRITSKLQHHKCGFCHLLLQEFPEFLAHRCCFITPKAQFSVQLSIKYQVREHKVDCCGDRCRAFWGCSYQGRGTVA